MIPGPDMFTVRHGLCLSSWHKNQAVIMFKKNQESTGFVNGRNAGRKFLKLELYLPAIQTEFTVGIMHY